MEMRERERTLKRKREIGLKKSEREHHTERDIVYVSIIESLRQFHRTLSRVWPVPELNEPRKYAERKSKKEREGETKR